MSKLFPASKRLLHKMIITYSEQDHDPYCEKKKAFNGIILPLAKFLDIRDLFGYWINNFGPTNFISVLNPLQEEILLSVNFEI